MGGGATGRGGGQRALFPGACTVLALLLLTAGHCPAGAEEVGPMAGTGGGRGWQGGGRSLQQASNCDIALDALLDANPVCRDLDDAIEVIKRKLISADEEDPDDREIATTEEMQAMCEHICYDRLKPVVIAQKDCYIQEMIAGRGAPLVKDGEVLTAREINGELALDKSKKVSAMACGKEPRLGQFCVGVRANFSVPDYQRRVVNPSYSVEARQLMCADLLDQGCCLFYSVPEEYERAVVQDYVLLDTPTGTVEYVEVLQSLKTPMEIACGFGAFPKSDCETEAEDLEGRMRATIEGGGEPTVYTLEADLVLDGMSATYPYADEPTFYVNREVHLIGRCGVDGDLPCRVEAGTRQRRLFEVGPAGRLTLENVRLISGRTTGWGAGVRVVHGTATFRSVSFEGLHAERVLTRPGAPAPRGGGAVAAANGQLSFESCTFEGNSAQRPGGAVNLLDKTWANFSSNVFTGNTARGGGNDIWADNSSVVVIDPWDTRLSVPDNGVSVESHGVVTSSATLALAHDDGNKCTWECYVGEFGEFLDRDDLCKAECGGRDLEEFLGCRYDRYTMACTCRCELVGGVGFGMVLLGFAGFYIAVQVVCSLRWYKYRKVPAEMHQKAA